MLKKQNFNYRKRQSGYTATHDSQRLYIYMVVCTFDSRYCPFGQHETDVVSFTKYMVFVNRGMEGEAYLIRKYLSQLPFKEN